MSSALGYSGYRYGSGYGYNPSSNYLAPVSNPEQTLANITRQEYMDYMDNFAGFEEDLVRQSQEDTSLIDAAREASDQTPALMRGVNQRNIDRYGASLTPAQRQAMERNLERSSALGYVQNVNNAKRAQKDINNQLQAQLISMSQGISANAMQGLGEAAASQSARNQAYEAAKAQRKASIYQGVGSLASTAIMFAMFASDRRMKENVKKVGVSDRGINIYEFAYIGANGRYQGVMAHEVPWAVVEADNGYFKVDYTKVDVEFKRVA